MKKPNTVNPTSLYETAVRPVAQVMRIRRLPMRNLVSSLFVI